MIDIALSPVFHALIHFLQHFADSDRQHHVTQGWYKKCGDIHQHQPDILVQLPTLLAFAFIQYPGRHRQHLRVGEHVSELYRTQVMRCWHAQWRGCQAQIVWFGIDPLNKRRPGAQGHKAREKLCVVRVQQPLF